MQLERRISAIPTILPYLMFVNIDNKIRLLRASEMKALTAHLAMASQNTILIGTIKTKNDVFKIKLPRSPI